MVLVDCNGLLDTLRCLRSLEGVRQPRTFIVHSAFSEGPSQ